MSITRTSVVIVSSRKEPNFGTRRAARSNSERSTRGSAGRHVVTRALTRTLTRRSEDPSDYGGRDPYRPSVFVGRGTSGMGWARGPSSTLDDEALCGYKKGVCVCLSLVSGEVGPGLRYSDVTGDGEEVSPGQDRVFGRSPTVPG